MANMNWRDAVITALGKTNNALHYTEISDAIAEQGLRTEVGATPANTVAAVITSSIKEEGDASPFVRVARGYYQLRSGAAGGPVHPQEPQAAGTPAAPATPAATAAHETAAAIAEETAEDTGLINAFGMYWSRDLVLWRTHPRLLGQQQPGAKAVDFCGQKGVYLLHDGRSVVYVGRTTDQPLGVRLRQHTTDRLNGRWGRFSWFGIHKVNDDGTLVSIIDAEFNLNTLIATMEALLIEGLEPPQNRKRGDDFRAVEFLQVEDEEIRKSRIIALMDELKAKL